MSSAIVWGYIHIILVVFWIGAELGVFVSTALIRRAQLSYDARVALLKVATITHVVPRVCFALILPVGIELTGAINVYPLTPGLQTASWITSVIWLFIIVAHVCAAGFPAASTLRHLDLFFKTVAGLGLVVYGLNSLATGAPIDETWFAAKLFLVGLVFWVTIAVDLCFRPFFAPFLELRKYGATPDREEAITRAANHALLAMGALYFLLAAIAFVGKVKPF